MLVFAAGVWEKLRNVPPKNLGYLGMAILVLMSRSF